MATPRVPLWLHSFTTSNYSLPSLNLFCVSCSSGALTALDFQPNHPHANHAYLQVRRHTFRNHVVNVADLTRFIANAETHLQRFVTNKVPTFSLRARNHAGDPARNQGRRVCECCRDSLSSKSPEVTLCSIECLLRDAKRFLVTDKGDAPKAVEAPKRRSRWDGIPVVVEVATLEEESVREEGEVDSASEGEVESYVTPEVVNLEEENETVEVGAPAGVSITSATAEKMWSQAKESAIDATFKGDVEMDWHHVGSVWSAGTYARFLTSILSRKDRAGGADRSVA